MWTPTTRAQHSRADLRYGSDVTDAEWLVPAPFLPAPRPLRLPAQVGDARDRQRHFLRAARRDRLGPSAEGRTFRPFPRPIAGSPGSATMVSGSGSTIIW